MHSRIAVIDDDTVFLELMEELLGHGEGYQVFTCSSWIDSVQLVREVMPDLVMLDLMLGRDKSGWAILEQLRREPGLAELPVILCTAAAPALARAEPRANVEFVAKPFDIDDLLATIERLLARTPASAVVE
jgi:CheY-like chemotaxis protein